MCEMHVILGAQFFDALKGGIFLGFGLRVFARPAHTSAKRSLIQVIWRNFVEVLSIDCNLAGLEGIQRKRREVIRMERWETFIAASAMEKNQVQPGFF